jgi:hypothetical protein
MAWIDQFFGQSNADDIAATIANCCGAPNDASFVAKSISDGLVVTAGCNLIHSEVKLDNELRLIVGEMNVQGNIKDAAEVLARQVKGLLSFDEIQDYSITYRPEAVNRIVGAPLRQSPEKQWEEAGLSNGSLKFSSNDNYEGLSRLKSVFNALVGNFDKYLGVQIGNGEEPIDEKIKKLPKSVSTFSKIGYNVKLQQFEPSEDESIALSMLCKRFDELNGILKPQTRKAKTNSQYNMHYALRTPVRMAKTMKTLDALSSKSITASKSVARFSIDVPTSSPLFRKLVDVGSVITERGYTKLISNDSDNITIELTIPKGTTIFICGSDQQVLNRNAKLRVTSVHKTGDGKFEIEAEVIK